MKKKVRILYAAATSFFLIQGTQAYLTDQDGTVNVLKAGYQHSEISEVFPPVSPTPLIKNPIYTKKVQIVNNASEGNVPCYVRVRILYSNDDLARAVDLLDMDLTNWIYSSGDGFYYYKNILMPGEATTPLFGRIQLLKDAAEPTYQEQIEYLDLDVYEESIQAEGFADYQSAWEAVCGSSASM